MVKTIFFSIFSLYCVGANAQDSKKDPPKDTWLNTWSRPINSQANSTVTITSAGIEGVYNVQIDRQSYTPSFCVVNPITHTCDTPPPYPASSTELKCTLENNELIDCLIIASEPDSPAKIAETGISFPKITKDDDAFSISVNELNTTDKGSLLGIKNFYLPNHSIPYNFSSTVWSPDPTLPNCQNKNLEADAASDNMVSFIINNVGSQGQFNMYGMMSFDLDDVNNPKNLTVRVGFADPRFPASATLSADKKTITFDKPVPFADSDDNQCKALSYTMH